MNDVKETEKVWKIIENDFLRYYIYRLWGGNLQERTSVAREDVNKFDYQFLDAVRDVERDMLTGRSTLLKGVLDLFLDYDIKVLPEKDETQKQEAIKARKAEFGEEAADGKRSTFIL